MNTQWCLISRPEGEAKQENFEIRESDMPQPQEGEVLIRNIYLLVPPSMRLWMNEKESYFPAQPLGHVMMGITLGQVEASNHPDYQPGMYVNGMGGWQDYYVSPAEQLVPVMKHPDVDLAVYRTVLDVQGLTAYGGVTEILKPKAGETLVVTAAAGSVGSLACQIGKKLGLKVIGVAGGPEKCAWLMNECGIDAAIDYKHEDVAARLDELAPEGIDMLYENVGGPVMDAVLERINQGARIGLCGLVSSYNGEVKQSTTALMQMINKCAHMEGFLVLNFMERAVEMIGQLHAWVLDGSLKYQIEIIDGLDNTLQAMGNVYHSRNKGIQLVRISDE